MRARWIFALLPAGVGLILALMNYVGWLANPVLYLRADRGTLFLLLGLLVSALTCAYLLGINHLEKSHRRTLQQTHDDEMQERRRFMQRLDHEFKNPLMALRADLASLTNRSTDPIQREILAMAQSQVLRLRQFTGDMGKLARLETYPLELESVDTAELLRQAVTLAQEQPAARERHLHLTLPQAPWPLPAIPGDRELLLTAVANLLDNALKFTRPGDTVEVRASEDDRFVKIEVADTGPGIPEDEISHIGKELYRGQQALGVPGSGLGMAMVQAIVERHGGQVTIRSRVDEGTEVTLRLPAITSS